MTEAKRNAFEGIVRRLTALSLSVEWLGVGKPITQKMYDEACRLNLEIRQLNKGE